MFKIIQILAISIGTLGLLSCSQDQPNELNKITPTSDTYTCCCNPPFWKHPTWVKGVNNQFTDKICSEAYTAATQCSDSCKNDSPVFGAN